MAAFGGPYAASIMSAIRRLLASDNTWSGVNTFSGGVVGVGTVTSVSVTTANGVSGTVATATTTPAITLTLGAITPTSTTIGTTSTAGTATLTLKSTMTGAGATDNFLNVTGTLPTVPASSSRGNALLITSAGSASITQSALVLNLQAGYTGSSSTIGLNLTNSSAGTATGGLSNGSCNSGTNSTVSGVTVGHNLGGNFVANSSSILNIGAVARASAATSTPALNVGLAAFALNGTVSVGGFFGLMSTAPTLASSAALIADNAAVAADIFVARDNGTAVMTVADGGATTFTAPVTALGLSATGVTAIKTANYTINTDNTRDFTVRCDTSGGGFSATLPLASGVIGQIVNIKLVTGGNTLTIARTSSDTIDGATSITSSTTGAAYQLQAAASGLWIVL